jgi:putative redox protein
MAQDERGGGAVAAQATGKGRFQTEIALRGGPILADEPVEVGGEGSGPTPYELLSAALAACTSMTLRLYAERKGWELPPFRVEVAHSLVPGSSPRDRFTREIVYDGALGGEQGARLLEIADKCPVHRTLMRGFEIVTRSATSSVPFPGEPPCQHERDMESACADT